MQQSRLAAAVVLPLPVGGAGRGHLAATHPFSGLNGSLRAHGAACSPCAHRLRRFRQVATIWRELVAFLAYNFWFLESFPSHRALRQVWSLNWSPSVVTQIAAYSVPAAMATARIVGDLRAGRQISASVGFFATAAAVSLILSNHHLFVAPRQPLHFTRGYVWFALMMISMPVLDRGLTWLRARFSGGQFLAVTAGLLIVSACDNVVFLWKPLDMARNAKINLTPDERDALSCWPSGLRIVLCRFSNGIFGRFTSSPVVCGTSIQHPKPFRVTFVRNSWRSLVRREARG